MRIVNSAFVVILVPAALIVLLTGKMPSATTPSLSAKKAPAESPKPTVKSKELSTLTEINSGVIDLLKEFLGIPLKEKTTPTQLQTRVQVEWLIATIPDPEQSRLPYYFDAFLDAMQRAIEIKGYVQDRSKLPWRKERSTSESAAGAEKKSPKEEKEALEATPGIILFRSPEKAEGEKIKLLALYLIGESPTSGIHKEAMKKALQEIHDFHNNPGQEFRILGPAFSGSATSLSLAIQDWLRKKPADYHAQFTLIGTATAVKPDTLTQDMLSSIPSQKVTASWRSTLVPDEYARQAFYSYLLHQLGTIRSPEESSRGFEVALLTEGTTFYGQQQRQTVTSTPAPGTTSQPAAQVSTNYNQQILQLTFPLHIARLRSLVWKNPATRTTSTHDPFNFQSAMTPLPLEEDLGTIVPLFSDVSANYAEVVLSTILGEIERQRIRYLGIVATDIRDCIFLAREIRRNSPNLVLFFFTTDLLFLHPEANRDFQGSLVVSTYPLAPQNKLWTTAFNQQKRWLQFPIQGAQGVFNATLALLGRADAMQEYEPPRLKTSANATPGDGPQRPALWLSVIGRDNIWPLTTLKLSPEYPAGLSSQEFEALNKQLERYLYPDPSATPAVASIAPPTSPPVNSRKRFHSEAAYISFHLLVFIVCLLPTYSFFSFLTKLLSRRRKQQREVGWHWGWMIFDKPVDEENHRLALQRWMYMTGCLLALLCLSVPMWLLSFVPVYTGHWNHFARLGYVLIGTVFFCATLVVLWHLFALLYAFLWLVWETVQVLRQKVPHNFWRTAQEYGILGSFVLALPLSAFVLLVGRHFIGSYIHRSEVEWILLWERTVGNFSGVSPLLPVALIATATLTWALCALRRLRLMERGKPRAGELSFLMLPAFIPEKGATGSAARQENKDITRLEHKIHRWLSCAIHRLPGWSWTVATLLAACALTMGAKLMPSVEGLWFNRGITALFVLAYLSIALNFLRFLVVWSALQRLLRRLSWHPLLMGYHLPKPEQCPVLGNLRLELSTPLPTFTSLTKSVEQARHLCRLLQHNENLTEGKVESSLIRKAETDLATALDFDAQNKWQHAFAKRNAVRLRLVAFSEQVAKLLHKQWSIEIEEGPEAKSTAPVVTSPTLSGVSVTALVGTQPPRRAYLGRKPVTNGNTNNLAATKEKILEQSEHFLVSRLIGFLQYVLEQMQNLVVFVTAGILLMLGAVLSYPFQPMSPLLIFNWITIVTVVAITMLIFVQMNRNPTLSLLSGTQPGAVNWNSQFILQVLVHGLLPLLAITGAQFSDSLHELMGWIGLTSHGGAQ